VKVVATFAEAREHRSGSTVLVPTMGYLHRGHRSLMERARTVGDTVIVSIFVNPLQFNDPEDLAAYPRDLDGDLDTCRSTGVDIVFVPSVEEMYPSEPLTSVHVGGVTDRMEGPRRPGHFDGVATVVSKLFAGIRPDAACFGRKDAQQLAVVRTMTRDLSFPTEIIACSTVRDNDGLALSSRNVFLDAGERRRALGLSRGLFAAADAVESGVRDGSAIESIAHDLMSEVDVEYVELAAQDDAAHLPQLDRPAFLAVAARVGATRLIDNVAFDSPAFVADRGVGA
jgi:pantoate--beta-alanine ligase